ncbi:hypothetical protein BG004_005170 [Podila humilis]|nr:hypothetical protein BG004_005170 [Podila humilis]
MWQEDDSASTFLHSHESSEPSSPRPSVVSLPSSTLPANLISRPAAYTIGTKSRSYSNDPSPASTASSASLTHHHLPIRPPGHHHISSHRKSTSISSNTSSTGTAGTTGTSGTTGTGLSSISRVTFADQVLANCNSTTNKASTATTAFPAGQEPDRISTELSSPLSRSSDFFADIEDSDLISNNKNTEQETIMVSSKHDHALSVTTDNNNNMDSIHQSPTGSPSTPSSLNGLTSPTALKRGQLGRASSLHRSSTSVETMDSISAPLTGVSNTGVTSPISASLSRQSSLSLNLGRKSSMSKKTNSTNNVSNSSKAQSDHHRGDSSVPPSPSSTHRAQRHVMLNRRSVSQDFQLRLQQQQQRQDELGEELSEAGEDIPGTPSSVSSFGSASGRQSRINRNSVALIESRNIQTLSSNLAMISSPTESEFPQQTSESLLSVIAQKEARIAQLREDLETNLSELTQLKERWSQMMILERNRQQAEASASIQQQEQQLYGHSSAQSVSHRLSTTGAGLWGSVVGSVSGISGVSGGISLHNINSIHSQHHHSHGHSTGEQEPVTTQPRRSHSNHNGLISGRGNSSGTLSRSESQKRPQSPNRPTSPLPAYLSGFSSLNGLNSSPPPSSLHQSGQILTTARGDRASFSSMSTISSSHSNAGDVPTAFEAGHSSQSSFSSAGGFRQDETQLSLKEQHRESRRTKRESSGLFITPEAEEVLVNTGRALFKGFGSIIGGIRTVVNDVAESDRFQHSRQRTMDMVSGLAQTAADALPLPSHDDIYYHHQRLNLLDEDDEEGGGDEEHRRRRQEEMFLQQQKIELQQAKEQRRQERAQEKERRQLERNKSGIDESDPAESLTAETASSARPKGNLVRRSSSRKKLVSGETNGGGGGGSLSRSVNQLSVQEEPKSVKKQHDLMGMEMEDGASGWDNLEDKELLAALEAEKSTLEIQNKTKTMTTTTTTTTENVTEVVEADLLGLGLQYDTPAWNNVVASASASSSKKDD